jgi:hypothetical protein
MRKTSGAARRRRPQTVTGIKKRTAKRVSNIKENAQSKKKNARQAARKRTAAVTNKAETKKKNIKKTAKERVAEVKSKDLARQKEEKRIAKIRAEKKEKVSKINKRTEKRVDKIQDKKKERVSNVNTRTKKRVSKAEKQAEKRVSKAEKQAEKRIEAKKSSRPGKTKGGRGTGTRFDTNPAKEKYAQLNAEKQAGQKPNNAVAGDGLTGGSGASKDAKVDIQTFDQLLGKLEKSKKRQQRQRSVEGRRDIYAGGLASMMSNF